MAPTDRKYQSSHEWAKEENGLVVVGITDVAVQRLSDLVYIDLPQQGKTVQRGMDDWPRKFNHPGADKKSCPRCEGSGMGGDGEPCTCPKGKRLKDRLDKTRGK